jgi:restriction system protein
MEKAMLSQRIDTRRLRSLMQLGAQSNAMQSGLGAAGSCRGCGAPIDEGLDGSAGARAPCPHCGSTARADHGLVEEGIVAGGVISASMRAPVEVLAAVEASAAFRVEAVIGQPLPALTLKALLDFGENNRHGQLIREVAVPWFEIMKMLQQDPAGVYQIDWRKWEEIIAGAYKRAGFDEVILTPRSGDGGKDIIATKKGVGSICIFDQVRAYTPPRLVSAEEVRAMLGVITGHLNVSKGIITTTSEFAPRVADDPGLAPFIPYRLELKPRDALLRWLAKLSGRDE